MRSVTRKFDSLTDMVETAARVPADWNGDTPSAHQTDAEYVEFCGSDSFDAAADLALMGGWNDPQLSEVDSVVADCMAKVRDGGGATAWDAVYDTVGATWDLDSYLSGSPEHMVTWNPRPTKGRGQMVRVLVNLGALGNVSTGTMIRRGAALVALCDVLATIGKSVEVWAATSCTSSGSQWKSTARWTSAVRLKAATDPYDRGALLFALAHPSMHRRVTFGVRANENREMRDRWGFGKWEGMGKTADLPDTLVSDLDPDVKLVKGLHNGDMADPAGWVLDQLEGLGLLDG
jgi:hypothetical protein